MSERNTSAGGRNHDRVCQEPGEEWSDSVWSVIGEAMSASLTASFCVC